MKRILAVILISLTFNLNAQNALNFDGNNDYVQCVFSGPTGNASRTVEGWINILSLNSAQKVICDWGDMANGHRFTFNIINGIPRIEVGGYGVSAPGSISLSTWHHIAATYDGIGNELKLYVDGVLANSGIPSVAVMTSSTNGILIGRRNDMTNYFAGKIDEVRIWNTVRTPAEILASKNRELCLPVSGLNYYYQFNEGTANGNNAGVTTLPDLSGNINSGTLNGFALTGTTSNWIAGINTSYQVTDTFCLGSPYIFGSQVLTSGGVYTETFTTTQGCDSVVSLTLVPVSVNSTVLQAGVVLVSQQLGGNYQWVDCNNNYAALPGQTNSTFTATSNGSYAVIVSKNNCVDTSACFSITVSGVSETQSAMDMNFAPNPAGSFCLVSAPTYSAATMKLYDPTGRCLQVLPFDQSLELQLDQFSDGVYFVELNMDSKHLIRRLIVCH